MHVFFALLFTMYFIFFCNSYIYNLVYCLFFLFSGSNNFRLFCSDSTIVFGILYISIFFYVVLVFLYTLILTEFTKIFFFSKYINYNNILSVFYHYYSSLINIVCDVKKRA